MQRSVFVLIAAIAVCVAAAPRNPIDVLELRKNFASTFLDREDYLSFLADEAAVSFIRSAVIIAGPRGVGKSAGLIHMISAWKASDDYAVFHVELDTPSSNQDVAMSELADNIISFWDSGQHISCLAI